MFDTIRKLHASFGRDSHTSDKRMQAGYAELAIKIPRGNNSQAVATLMHCDLAAFAKHDRVTLIGHVIWNLTNGT